MASNKKHSANENRKFTLTIRQTEIPALLDGWITTHLLSKCCVHDSQYFQGIPRKDGARSALNQ